MPMAAGLFPGKQGPFWLLPGLALIHWPRGIRLPIKRLIYVADRVHADFETYERRLVLQFMNVLLAPTGKSSRRFTIG